MKQSTLFLLGGAALLAVWKLTQSKQSSPAAGASYGSPFAGPAIGANSAALGQLANQQAAQQSTGLAGLFNSLLGALGKGSGGGIKIGGGGGSGSSSRTSTAPQPASSGSENSWENSISAQNLDRMQQEFSGGLFDTNSDPGSVYTGSFGTPAQAQSAYDLESAMAAGTNSNNFGGTLSPDVQALLNSAYSQYGGVSGNYPGGVVPLSDLGLSPSQINQIGEAYNFPTAAPSGGPYDWYPADSNAFGGNEYSGTSFNPYDVVDVWGLGDFAGGGEF